MTTRMEVLNKALDFTDILEQSDIYIKYMNLKKDIENNEDIKSLVRDFEDCKIKYEEVKEYGKYHPDYKDVSEQLIKAKTSLYEHKDVKEFKSIENELNDLIRTITLKLEDLVKTDTPKSQCHVPKN